MVYDEVVVALEMAVPIMLILDLKEKAMSELKSLKNGIVAFLGIMVLTETYSSSHKTLRILRPT